MLFSPARYRLPAACSGSVYNLGGRVLVRAVRRHARALRRALREDLVGAALLREIKDLICLPCERHHRVVAQPAIERLA